MIAVASAREQSRARYPDEEGYVERDGVRVFYEVYGDAPTTFLLFPTGPISHSRLWKAQIPYLSRHFRVVTFDPRGNGRSDRPTAAGGLLALGVRRRRSCRPRGGRRRRRRCSAGSATGAARRSCSPRRTRLSRSVSFAIAPFVPMLTPAHPNYLGSPFDEQLDTDEAWAKCNRHYWRRDYRDFLEFFFAQQLPEPHSTKQIEDCVEWGLEGDVEALILFGWRVAASVGERGGRASALHARALSGARSSRRARRVPDRETRLQPWSSSPAGRSSRWRASATSRRRVTR